MDPRKAKGVSTSTRGRGRGSRSQLVRPSMNRQYHPHQMTPQSAYYPQPPPMNPQYHQHQYFSQPPPMNPSQYNILMTREFDPFTDYREGPSHREPSVERQLPLYDDDDDDVQFVPETQLQTQIDDEEVQGKKKTIADKKLWTAAEEVALAKVWVYVSTWQKVGNEQNRDSF